MGLLYFLQARAGGNKTQGAQKFDIRQNAAPRIDTGAAVQRVIDDQPPAELGLPVLDEHPVIAANSNEPAPDRETSVQTRELVHDLKNPLNALIGFASLMEQESKGPLPAAYRDYPALIRQSGETIQELIDAFMRSAGAAPAMSAKPASQAVSLDEAAREAIARFLLQADEKQIEMVLLEDAQAVMAEADPLMVTRIIDNLLSNALKYSNPGGKVFILVQTREDGAYLGVRDLGDGMNPTDLERIGKRFVQGENARGRPGTGLGLSIVSELAEKQSGNVIVRSAPGEGTEVEVMLPHALAR